MMIPIEVEAVAQAGADAGFEMSCDPGVGQLIGVLAAAVPSNGAILELGTGVGVGLAWTLLGLRGRTDAHVLSVELDSEIAAIAAKRDWPDFVELEVGDALEVLVREHRWDLIFADAQGGKWDGLDSTIEALAPGAVLLVDDMTPPEFVSDLHRDKTLEVRERLLADRRLVSVEIGWSTGIILCTRRHGD